MIQLLLQASLLVSPPPPVPLEPGCGMSLGPAVPDAKTARLIAEAVIAAQQSPQKTEEYHLTVEPDEDQPSEWVAFQSLPAPQNNDPETIVVIMGGGGIAMRINRCNGQISDMHYQR